MLGAIPFNCHLIKINIQKPNVYEYLSNCEQSMYIESTIKMQM